MNYKKILIGLETDNNGVISISSKNIKEENEDKIIKKIYFEFNEQLDKLKKYILEKENIFSFTSLKDYHSFSLRNDQDVFLFFQKNQNILTFDKEKNKILNLKDKIIASNSKKIKPEHFYKFKDQNINRELDNWLKNLSIEEFSKIVSFNLYNCNKDLYDSVYKDKNHSFLIIGGLLSIIYKNINGASTIQIIDIEKIPPFIREKVSKILTSSQNYTEIFANLGNDYNPEKDLINNYSNDELNQAQFKDINEELKSKINEIQEQMSLFDQDQLKPSHPRDVPSREEIIFRRNKK